MSPMIYQEKRGGYLLFKIHLSTPSLYLHSQLRLVPLPEEKEKYISGLGISHEPCPRTTLPLSESLSYSSKLERDNNTPIPCPLTSDCEEGGDRPFLQISRTPYLWDGNPYSLRPR